MTQYQIADRSPLPSAILYADNLRKNYGRREALRGLSFALEPAHILGFLGPNGAGKTTAIRILTTILEPDSGDFVVAGVSSRFPEQIRRHIGVLPENLGFPRQMTALEYLVFYGQLYGQTAARARERARVLLEEVGMLQRATSLIGTYSHGMRQRLGIARALVNDPTVVFLDEPTLGLDPRGQKELLALIRRIATERSAGVVLCSHLLWEVEATCDDVVILNSGRVVAAGSVAEVIGHARQGAIRRNVLRILVSPAFVAEARHVLAAQSQVVAASVLAESPGWLRVELEEAGNQVPPAESYVNNRVLDSLIRAEIPILSFEAEGGRLQDVFLHLTEEAIT